jgi:hypothetical protein
MGYSSSTPHGISLGHQKYGGLGLTNVRIEQGVRNLIILKTGLYCQSPISNMIQITTKWWWFQLGTENNPFQYNPSDITYIKTNWFAQIHHFVHDYGIIINMRFNNYPKLRKNDAYIMELLLQQGYLQKIVGNINQCRLFLHVLTLSDIVDVTGKFITSTNYVHQEAATMNTQQITAFQVSKPNKSVWSYWTKFLNELVYPKTRQLRMPLGPWTAQVNAIRRKFPLYRDITHLYKKQYQSYVKKNIISGEREKSIELPNTVIPCIQTVTGNIVPEYDLVVVEDSKETYKINLPKLTLQNNTIIVTNASVHGETAAFSWVIADPKRELLFQYQQRISETSISSFRAEAIGVLSALKETYFIIQQQNVTSTLYCDNLSVIKRLNYIQHQEPKIEWINSDVLLAIKKYIPKGGKFCHVKGHQQHSMDNSIPEKLNILVDKQANEEIQGNIVNNLIEFVMNIKGGKSSLYSITQIISYCQERISTEYL